MPTAVAAPPRGPKPLTDDRKNRVEQVLLYVIVIVPFASIACPALTSRLRKTWFRRDVRHSTSGNLP